MIFGTDIGAIVFDMDGVLWHSSAIHAAAYRAVLEGAGLRMPDYQRIAGRRTDEVIRELLAAQRPGAADAGDAVARLTAAKQERARRLLRDQPPLARDCGRVLKQLGQTRALALASSASAGTVELFLEVSATRSLFKTVLSGDDVAAAKPDPAIYLTALRRLACDPAGAAVIEDAPSGIQAALAAGIALVVAIEGTAPREALAEAGARHVIRDLTDLVA